MPHERLHQRLDERGFAVRRRLVGGGALAALKAAFAEPGGNRRNVLDEVPAPASILRDAALAALARSLFSADARPAAVRGIAFDKHPGANWAVPWHQDLSIAVAARPAPADEPAGFGPWSVKAGVTHVEPPAGLLARMLTVRIHLDDADAGNGALRVRPGSHRAGRLADATAWAGPPEEILEVRAGDAVLMRPLLLHASSRAQRPTRRRVLHLELAGEPLPPPLQWAAWRPVGVPAG